MEGEDEPMGGTESRPSSINYNEKRRRIEGVGEVDLGRRLTFVFEPPRQQYTTIYCLYLLVWSLTSR